MLGPLFCHLVLFQGFLPFAYLRSSFSLSYGCNLPSSLTRVFPRTLGFSPRLPVSVYGTGGYFLTRSFSWQCRIYEFVILSYNSPSCLCFQNQGFASDSTYALGRALPVARSYAFLRRSIAQTIVSGTGISTCCPSVTSFDLALGPDLPRADQLYSGNLRYSAGRILTFLSLLIPAFSLLYSPQLLIGTASSRIQCSSTN